MLRRPDQRKSSTTGEATHQVGAFLATDEWCCLRLIDVFPSCVLLAATRPEGAGQVGSALRFGL